MSDSHRGEEAESRETDAHREVETEARTGNSHKEMKIKGGITGRGEARSNPQDIREVGGMGGPVYYSHGTAPSQLLRCVRTTRTIHTHPRCPFSHFPLGSRYRWQTAPTTARPGGVQTSDLTHVSREEGNLAINSVLRVIF